MELLIFYRHIFIYFWSLIIILHCPWYHNFRCKILFKYTSLTMTCQHNEVSEFCKHIFFLERQQVHFSSGQKQEWWTWESFNALWILYGYLNFEGENASSGHCDKENQDKRSTWHRKWNQWMAPRPPHHPWSWDAFLAIGLTYLLVAQVVNFGSWTVALPLEQKFLCTWLFFFLQFSLLS